MGRLEEANFPCKDCEKRHVGCHSKCEGYISSKKKLEEYDILAGDKRLADYSVPLTDYRNKSKSWREKRERKLRNR